MEGTLPRRPSIFSLLPLVASACLASGRLQYELKLPEYHASLRNGAHVILLPDPSSELIEVDVRYEVGSKEDPPGKAGLAHLVEHLRFEQRLDGPDQPRFAVVLGQRALYYNAYTDRDSTHYETLARADEIESLIALEAVRLATGCQALDQRTFEREREVVRNEIRVRDGTPAQHMLTHVIEAAYPDGHAYRRPIAGDDAQVASITIDDVCAFMNDYYVPERATLIIAGKVSSKEEVAAIVDRSFGAVPARPGKQLAPVAPSPVQKRTVTIEADVDETTVFAVWPLPPRYSRDESALSYMIGAVGFGSSYASSRSLQELTTSVRPRLLGGARAPLLAVEARLRDGSKVDEVIEAIWSRARGAYRLVGVDRFFKDRQLVRIGYLVMALEDLGTRARAFGDYAQLDPEKKYFAGELARAREVTAASVQQITERYLDPDRATVVIVKPRSGQDLYRRAAGAFAVSAETPVEDLAIDLSEAATSIAVPSRLGPLAGVRRFELENGLKVVLVPTAPSLPIMTASVIFGGGHAAEPAALAGISETAALFIDPPIATRQGYLESMDGFADLGIDYEARVAADHTAFAAHGLSIYQNHILDGLASMLKKASYHTRAFDDLHARAEFFLRSRGDRARVAAEKHLLATLYGADHPYARTAVPSPETFKSIGYDETRDFATRSYTAANATLVVAGRFDAASAESEIRNVFGRWDRGKPTPPVTTPATERDGPAHVAIDGGEDSPNVEVRIAYPAPGGRGPEFASRLVLAEMLNHQVAAVRENLAASYGVHARYARRVGPAFYDIGGPVDAERAGEALGAIRSSIDALRQGRGFLESFVRARRRVLRTLLSTSSDSGTLASEVMELAEQGLPPAALEELCQQVGAVTPARVLHLAKLELRPEAEVVVAVGRLDKVQRMYAEAGISDVTQGK